ncbi:aminotransferase class I/II-fold pyridoxal phosphate-dependent enzyme [Faecalispora anaeroviscerum]|uniref:aminotransferase class I/II-fold pyridoxal phosphate-dependent enzyme n=1 Tax=Faecalispora anaeroviscerum TaxID=2991836 RepID=UPI0024BBAA33|nr:aminotransferase class I/II-fold pyridoxal phosphate-dependent enzyme [Faecalispora anaeroviscerum]
MTDTPLYTALLEHQQKNRSSFHTPGHKNAPGALPRDLLSLDFTELPDTDSLFEADGAILAAEQRAAQLFGARRTLFSAGGCTLCLQAMLYLAAPRGGTILFDRVLHRSVVHTMALLDITPVWILPRPSAGRGLPGRVDSRDVLSALREHPDAKAVFLTSPDYYGVLADIPAVSAVCRERGIPLLVDNAHGTHLAFLKENRHPLYLGASATACSAHKTLPVLTGGAWLNLAEPSFAPDAKRAMALFGSTSPSYPIMASLDLARAWLEENGRAAFAALEERAAAVRELAARLGFPAPEGECDPVRLTLRTAEAGILGTDAAELLRGHGVEPEYADSAQLVLIATPFNSETDFQRLEEAIRALNPGKTKPETKPALPALPPALLTPRQALLSPAEEVPLARSVGRIAAETSCPCPPGVPVVMPGEKITDEIAEFLRGYGIFSLKVVK